MDHWNFQFPKLSEMTQLDIKLHLTLPSFIYFARSTRMLGLFPFFPAFSTINLTNQPYICVFDWKKRHLDLCRNTYSVKIASIRPAIIISKPFYPHTIFFYWKAMHDWPKAQKIEFEILSETTGKLQKCVKNASPTEPVSFFIFSKAVIMQMLKKKQVIIIDFKFTVSI